jgi:diguanylate cyclase (GGDEF)-like protein
MMCDTISFLSSSSSSGIQTLQLIEKTLETGSTSVDIRSLRGQLADCFVIVRNDSIRVREDTQNQIDMLQSGVQSARDHLASEFSTDPMTGLPGRAAAEQSIANTIAEGLDFAVALFMVDRVESINARFGRTVGDQMIRTMAQRLAQSASQPNSLLRWSGPAFLQVLKVGPDFSAVEQQVKKMALTRVQMNIETDGGSQMLAISCSSLLEKVKKTESAESVFRRLDAFIATRLGAQ